MALGILVNKGGSIDPEVLNEINEKLGTVKTDITYINFNEYPTGSGVRAIISDDLFKHIYDTLTIGDFTIDETYGTIAPVTAISSNFLNFLYDHTDLPENEGAVIEDSIFNSIKYELYVAPAENPVYTGYENRILIKINGGSIIFDIYPPAYEDLTPEAAYIDSLTGKLDVSFTFELQIEDSEVIVALQDQIDSITSIIGDLEPVATSKVIPIMASDNVIEQNVIESDEATINSLAEAMIKGPLLPGVLPAGGYQELSIDYNILRDLTLVDHLGDWQIIIDGILDFDMQLQNPDLGFISMYFEMTGGEYMYHLSFSSISVEEEIFTLDFGYSSMFTESPIYIIAFDVIRDDIDYLNVNMLLNKTVGEQLATLNGDISTLLARPNIVIVSSVDWDPYTNSEHYKENTIYVVTNREGPASVFVGYGYPYTPI